MSKPSKSSKRSRSQRSEDRSGTTDVMTQLAVAVRNPHAAMLGAVLGGGVPWFARTLAHEELPATWATGNHTLAFLMLAVILGCGLFSALTVFKFGKAAFNDPRKALGFVLALEGVMLVSHGTTSALALALLILINAIANGAVIALARDATRRRAEADLRRAATRARGKSAARGTAVDHGSPAVSNPPSGSTPRGADAVACPIVVPVRWRRATLTNATDAEIISEERLLA